MKFYKALLMAIIISLGLFYFLKYEKSEQSDQTSKKLFFFEPSRAAFISIKRADNYLDLIKAQDNKEKDKNPWTMMNPPGAPTEKKTIEKILKTLSEITVQKTIPPEQQSENKTVYGLNPPELSVIINDGQKEFRYNFGSLNFLSGRRYLQLEGDSNIYLIESLLFHNVDLIEGQLRESRPYSFTPKDVQEILAKPFTKELVQFAKEKDNSWSAYTSKGKLLVDSELIENDLRAIAEFQVEKFIDLEAEKSVYYGLNPADLTLEIRFKDNKNKPLKLLFGEAKKLSELENGYDPKAPKLLDLEKTKSEYFTKFEEEPWIYQMKGPIHRDFLKDPLELKTKELLKGLNPDKILSLAVSSTKNGNFVLKREEEAKTWIIYQSNSGTEKELNNELLSFYLNSLLGLKVLSYQENLNGDKFSNPELSIEIISSEEKGKSNLLRFGVPIAQEDKQSDTPVPRYLSFKNSQGQEVYAVVSGSLLLELDRNQESFLLKKDE